eukprot:CFRG7132T1
MKPLYALLVVAFVRGQCPDSSWTLYADNSKCIRVSKYFHTYRTSIQKCRAENGFLVSIHSDDEQKEIHAMLSTTSSTRRTDNPWIGLTYKGIPPVCQEGLEGETCRRQELDVSWRNNSYWLDGTAVDYTKWGTVDGIEQPAGLHVDDECTSLLVGDDSSRGWVTALCTDYKPFICMIGLGSNQLLARTYDSDDEDDDEEEESSPNTSSFPIPPNPCDRSPCAEREQCLIPANSTSSEDIICNCTPPYTGDLCRFTYLVQLTGNLSLFDQYKFSKKVANILKVPVDDVKVTKFDRATGETGMHISTSASERLTFLVREGDPTVTSLGIESVRKDQEVSFNPAINDPCRSTPCAHGGACQQLDTEDDDDDDHDERSNILPRRRPFNCVCIAPWTGDSCNFTYTVFVDSDISAFSAENFSKELSSNLNVGYDEVTVTKFRPGSVLASLSLSTKTSQLLTELVSAGDEHMVKMGVLAVSMNEIHSTNPGMSGFTEEDSDSTVWIIIVLAVLIVGALILAAVGGRWYWKRRCKNTKLKEKNISSVNTEVGLLGNGLAEETLDMVTSTGLGLVSVTPKKNAIFTASSKTFGYIGDRPLPDLPADIYQQIYKPEAIAIRDEVRRRQDPIPSSALIRMNVLGNGAFGLVYRGVLRDAHGDSPVAIKELKTSVEAEAALFVAEAELIRSLHHTNIVNCIGITPGPPLAILLELMTMGDLWTYLRSQGRRQSFVTIAERYCITFQIARGMYYLARHGVVHRDLAARNCMVSNPIEGTHGFPVVKVADFGLSRSVDGESYYRMESDGKVPVPWMSPEAIEDKKFSEASDVWAFGVTMWEIFANADSFPYQGQNIYSLLSFLKQGHRLDKPPKCPQESYDMMFDCWADAPNSRPLFQALTSRAAHLFVPHCSVPVEVKCEDNDVFIRSARFLSGSTDSCLQIQDFYIDMDRSAQARVESIDSVAVPYKNVDGDNDDDDVRYKNANPEVEGLSDDKLVIAMSPQLTQNANPEVEGLSDDKLEMVDENAHTVPKLDQTTRKKSYDKLLDAC